MSDIEEDRRLIGRIPTMSRDEVLRLLRNLQIREHAMETHLDVITDAVEAAKIALSPVKVGDIVESTHSRSKGKQFKVAEIDTRMDHEKPWVLGFARNKNGEFGNKVNRLFDDYKLIEKA